MQKKLIFSIVMIVVVLAIVFFSQQTYFKNEAKTLISAANNQIGAYAAKSAVAGIYSKLSNQVQQIQNGGAALQNGIDQGKEKISSVEKNIQNYVSGVANSLAGKNSCTTQPTQTAGQ